MGGGTNYFSYVSSYVQTFFANWLGDEHATLSFLQQSRDLLWAQYNKVRDYLIELRIPFTEPNGGLFVWADFREFLEEPTFEAERAFIRKLKENARVLVTPGEACRSTEPGFVRLCFACCPPEHVDRMFSALMDMDTIADRYKRPSDPDSPEEAGC